jgi:hypothetical protein
MATIGSAEGAKKLIRSSPSSTFNADQDARITELLGFVTRYIERKTGRVWGEASDPSPESRIVSSYGEIDTLYLPLGVKNVTAITYEPEWDGTIWSGGTALDTTDFELYPYGETYATTIKRISWPYSFGGRYLITGTWQDATTEIPADITYVANYLVAQFYKKQDASPAGFLGPDNAVMPIRKFLDEPEVLDVLKAYAIRGGEAKIPRAIIV